MLGLLNSSQNMNYSLPEEKGVTSFITEIGNNLTMILDHQHYWYQDLDKRASYLLCMPHRIIALILIVLAIAANMVSLVAMIHVRGKLTSHIRFLISLASSDILIAVSVLLHIVNLIVNPMWKAGTGPPEDRIISKCLYVVIKALNSTALNTALLNLIGMSVDAYVAVIKPNYYNTVKHYHRSSILIGCLWFIAFLCGFSDFIYSIHPYYNKRNIWKNDYVYCEIVDLSYYQEEYTVFGIALLCFITMTYMYSRIYFHVRCNSNSSNQPHGNLRSRRILLTTLLIIGTFIVCWLPLCIFNISLVVILKMNSNLLADSVKVLRQAEYYLYDLLLLNGICDPIIYTVRIREVQLAYKTILCSRCAKRIRLRRRSGTSLSFTSRQATFNHSENVALTEE